MISINWFLEMMEMNGNHIRDFISTLPPLKGGVDGNESSGRVEG